MVMKSYNQESLGRSVYTDYYFKTSQIQYLPLSQKSLSGIISFSGDFRSPNTHAYSKLVWRGLIGSVKTYVDGKLDSSREGAQSYPYSAVQSYADMSFETDLFNSALSEAFGELRGKTDISIDLVQWRQAFEMLNVRQRLINLIVRDARRLLPHIVRAETALGDMPIPKRKWARRRATVFKSTRDSRRVNRRARELNDSLNVLAQKRLEYVYGWKPLMDSIADLSKIATTPGKQGTFTVTGKAGSNRSTLELNSGISVEVPLRHTVLTSKRCRVSMTFAPVGDVLEKLGQISSLNPVSILYEATPFSFVLDWVVDVGGWLRNLETAFLHKNNFVSGYKSESVRVYVQSQMNGRSGSGSNFSEYALTGSAVYTRFARTYMSEIPFQRVPSVKFDMGLGRGLNAIALAKSTFLRADRLLASRR